MTKTQFRHILVRNVSFSVYSCIALSVREVGPAGIIVAHRRDKKAHCVSNHISHVLEWEPSSSRKAKQLFRERESCDLEQPEQDW